jgi:hypothetical protein
VSNFLTKKKSMRAAITAAALIGIAGFAGGAIAAPKTCDDGSRPPCDGGGGDVTTPDYGDLIILHRDDWGVPILDVNTCQQPIGFPENVGCPADDLIDLGDALVVPTDPDTCAIAAEHATCTEEADFGRTNTARSSDEVLESQLEDVIIGLAIADCTTLDAAGRMVHTRVDDLLVTNTIDSPLQNLAVYKKLMREGTIGVPLPQGADPLQTAARGLGVAMDKSGKVSVDLVVYLNEILGLTEGETIFGPDYPPICISVKEEVMGSIGLVEKCFLDYSAYTYNRTSNFATLPSPAYIPAGAPEDAVEGWFEFLSIFDQTTFPLDILYKVAEGPILQTVFSDGEGGFDPGFTNGNIGGFAQAADDTRAVINFMHNWPVPADGETEIPCAPRPDPTLMYDLSISDISGLKVPKQVVSTTEGREFSATVANAGPDTAAGTLTVTAAIAGGGDVLVDGEAGPFVFEFADILPGLSYTTGPVIFTLSGTTGGTTITWTAVAVPDDIDPYLDNNTVTETSNVR